MEQNQREQRREAEQEFQASLEQLEDILQENSTDNQEIPDIPTENTNTVAQSQDATDTNLAAWEDAVADIEHYLEERTKLRKRN
ncbi:MULTISPECIES: hypothetical protein [unclassified Anabaena]|uniref:hypothetical protein n=1 Tax=unclassified Anabaena TaxID=2619674 RepID=UPI0008357057|nr:MULTISPECIES: hypothetical protein [unclassified Anabaena]